MRLPCLHHCQCLTFPLAMAGSPTAPRQSDHPQNRGWWSNHHPKRSDCLALRNNVITYFANFSRTPHDTHDSDRTAPTSMILVMPHVVPMTLAAPPVAPTSQFSSCDAPPPLS
jgi:hypothetical protein